MQLIWANYPAGMTTENKPLALGVRGYACQVFSDAPVAWALHKETHLIAWRDESSNLRVDRFDARNLLDDASAFRRLKRKAAAGQEPSDAERTHELHRLRYGDYAVLYPEEEPNGEAQEETTEAAHEPAFKPPWPVPETVACLVRLLSVCPHADKADLSLSMQPSTAQAHEVVVSTARKAAAHPQLEILLRVRPGAAASGLWKLLLTVSVR